MPANQDRCAYRATSDFMGAAVAHRDFQQATASDEGERSQRWPFFVSAGADQQLQGAEVNMQTLQLSASRRKGNFNIGNEVAETIYVNDFPLQFLLFSED